ncbi:hypothetical protein E7681_04020 [Thalassobius vesicularis]|uniref:Uncharacterized protein n=1 Tax=Thalassobius vesicularis TaxID=1294297 RepID=A0A4V3UZ76_9RHOB|nr:hypothetical protein [Thalassobius vesicularis]THD75629.1 hypothetical protein E7681_04020 [Thalassobius vesicularis]
MTAIDATNAPATETKTSSPDTILLLATLLALVAWGASVFFFGVPGLYIPALALVPVMYVLLIIISRG